MNVLAALTLAGLGSYLIRASFIATATLRSSKALQGGVLDVVGPAAFAALIVTIIRGQLDVASGDPARFAALVVAGIVAWRTNNGPIVLLAGFAALIVGRLLVG